jgi:MFS family permease
MLDHAPQRRHATVAVINGTVPPVALGLGAVLSGVLVEFGPFHYQLTYAIVLGLTLVALAVVVLVDDPSPHHPGAWRSLIPRLACPPSVRTTFLVAAGYLCASWALIGLYLGIGPTITRELFSVTSPTVSGLAVLLMSGTGAVVGIALGRGGARHMMQVGGATMLAGVALMALAVSLENIELFLLATVVGGAGYGGSFQGGLRAVMTATPPAQRGATISLLYLVSYVAFGTPTLVAGLLIPHLGLETVVLGYGVVVVALTLGAWVLLSRTPATQRPAD